MTDKPDMTMRLRSRAEAPNAWTSDDYFLLEVADEIQRLRAEGAKLVDENNHLWEETDKLRDVLTELRTYIGQNTFTRTEAQQYIDAALIDYRDG